jgi:Fe-S-cluster containining protein
MLRQRSVSAPEPAPAWLSNGLRFACTRCGHCCSGSPGHVWVSVDESRAIAQCLGLTPEEFAKNHLRRVGMRLSLLEKKGGDCEFLIRLPDGLTSCAIHGVRPTQCRTWPLWKSNLRTARAWAEAARDCPGMNTGPRHALPAIQAALLANGDLPL